MRREGDPLVEHAREHRLELGDQRVDVDDARRQQLLAAEAEQPAREPRRPVHGARHLVQVGARLRRQRVVLVVRQREMAGDHREDVVEVVRDAPRQLAHRLDLLRVPEPRLLVGQQALARAGVRDVRDDRAHDWLGYAFAPDRRVELPDPPRAVGGDHRAQAVGAPLALNARQILVESGAVVQRHEVAEVRRHLFLGAHAEGAEHRRVHREEPSVERVRREDLAAVLHEIAVARLALAQRGLCRPLDPQIAHDGDRADDLAVVVAHRRGAAVDRDLLTVGPAHEHVVRDYRSDRSSACASGRHATGYGSPVQVYAVKHGSGSPLSSRGVSIPSATAAGFVYVMIPARSLTTTPMDNDSRIVAVRRSLSPSAASAAWSAFACRCCSDAVAQHRDEQPLAVLLVIGERDRHGDVHLRVEPQDDRVGRLPARLPRSGGQVALHRGAMPLAHLVRHQLRQRPSQQLGGGTAEQALRGGVERPEAAVRVHRDDRIGRASHQERGERITGGRGGVEDRRDPGGSRGHVVACSSRGAPKAGPADDRAAGAETMRPGVHGTGTGYVGTRYAVPFVVRAEFPSSKSSRGFKGSDSLKNDPRHGAVFKESDPLHAADARTSERPTPPYC